MGIRLHEVACQDQRAAAPMRADQIVPTHEDVLGLHTLRRSCVSLPLDVPRTHDRRNLFSAANLQRATLRLRLGCLFAAQAVVMARAARVEAAEVVDSTALYRGCGRNSAHLAIHASTNMPALRHWRRHQPLRSLSSFPLDASVSRVVTSCRSTAMQVV